MRVCVVYVVVVNVDVVASCTLVDDYPFFSSGYGRVGGGWRCLVLLF